MSRKIIGLVLILVLGGAVFGVYTWKMNAVAFQGISLPMQGIPDEKRKKWVETFEEVIVEKEAIQVMVKESDYQTVMGIEDEEAAIEDLGSRLKVKYRPRKNTIEIGLSGKRREVEEMKKITPFIYGICASVLATKDEHFKEYALREKSQ